MTRRLQSILAGAIAVATMLVAAPVAGAQITPTVTISTPTPVTAGATADVGLDFKFAPTGSDSPKDLTVKLPPGLLANASIDGGACLTSTIETSACQIGSGTVTASPIVLGMPVGSLSLSVAFYLVPPPQAADLAGVLVVANPGTALATSLGSPAAVTVRPATDPAGVGLNEVFTNIPDTFSGMPIAVDEINGTFTGLRMPASCPATPAAVSITADSYAPPSTPETASAPLPVTACSALPFAPAFTVTADKDSADSGVRVVTDITQNADEATSQKVALAFPAAVIAPNAAAVINDGLLCADPTFASCKAIGSASSTSPLYPKTLAGVTYLTGSLTAPAITIRFPAPFAITLSGTVDLATNTTTFTGLPDIPLTDLKVTLFGGPAAAFAASCNPSSGTATSTLTTQNGDRTISVPAAFTVSGCVSSAGGGPGTTGPPTTPSGTGNGGQTGNGQGRPPAGRPTLSGATVTGLGHRRPVLTFTARAGSGAPGIRSLQIQLPTGLSFLIHRVRGHVRILGASTKGAGLASVKLSHGRLVLTLRRVARRVTIKLSARALAETLGLARRARGHKLHSLRFGVVVRDAHAKATRLALKVTRLRL